MRVRIAISVDRHLPPPAFLSYRYNGGIRGYRQSKRCGSLLECETARSHEPVYSIALFVASLAMPAPFMARFVNLEAGRFLVVERA
jgi:hypothetical protein